MLIDWPFDSAFYPQNSLDEDTGMSAFGLIYTSEGFAIAADGLRTETDVPPESPRFVRSENVQKFFPIEDRERTLVYVLAGLAESDDGEFNINKEAAKQACRLSKRRFHSLHGYAENFCHNLNRSINIAIKKKHLDDLTTIQRVEEIPEAWIIATMIFAGYFQNKPAWARGVFFHYAHKKSEYFVKPEAIKNGLRYFHAPQKIIDATYPDPRNRELKPDPRFSQYIHPIGSGVSIEGNIKALEGLIKACSDPMALEMDYEKCKRIGGDIRTATVTPSGFRWISTG